MFEPTNDLLSCNDGLGKFFFSDLNTKFCFSRFKLVHTLFSRIVANSHLDKASSFTSSINEDGNDIRSKTLNPRFALQTFPGEFPEVLKKRKKPFRSCVCTHIRRYTASFSKFVAQISLQVMFCVSKTHNEGNLLPEVRL